MPEMSAEERRKNLELMERLWIAIIRGKLGGTLDVPKEERRTKEAQVRKCCLHYNRLKEMLGIK